MKERVNRWPEDYEILFWRAYPRRVGKLAAMKKLGVIHKADNVAWDTLMGAVRLYAKDCEKKERRYIAHPLTWLNQGRWEDEVASLTVEVNGVPHSGEVRGAYIWFNMEHPEYKRRGGKMTDRYCGWWFPREAA